MIYHKDLIFTPRDRIKTILGDKTHKWLIKDGYFELNLSYLVKYQLIIPQKTLIIYNFIPNCPHKSLSLVEIWNLCTWKPSKYTKNMKYLLYHKNIEQLGVKLLNPDVLLPNIHEFHPMRLIYHKGNHSETPKPTQLHHPVMLVLINNHQYLIQYNIFNNKTIPFTQPTCNYFDCFITPPIPIEFFNHVPHPYFYTDKINNGIMVHYPTKKKDRGKPKEQIVLPDVEKIYGYQLITHDFCQSQGFSQVVGGMRDGWLSYIHHKDDNL